MRFGRQRSPRDVATIALLFAGFSALALAFWLLTGNWLGLLLPLGFVVGAYATLRAEVREVELRGNTLLLRTFFRTYPIPRAHIRGLHGGEIEVLNGNRYAVVPAEANAEDVQRALQAWLYESPPES
ncbi:MAG TPA: hypothetical protein VEO54_19980 [Thermoanaerobaculia bacterium]|nr:hypothetical protein [Thermoanaerobaculia bacterium]